MDSDDQNSNEFAPFLNIMNEWYLRDLSRKQKTAIRVKGESGKPTTNCAIYGYRKDPENKYHWLIDEETAAVVRRIFRLTIEGKGPYDIARILFEDKVETPAVYFGKQGKGIWKSKEEFSNPYDWSGYVVGQILSPEYMGHTVNFRSHKQSYKDKNAGMNPREDWLIFEDTHEAIVDRETWELAQKLRKTPKRIDTLGEANPLTGLLYCADCGEKMYNHRSKGGTENNPYPSDFFRLLLLYPRPSEKNCRLLRPLYHDQGSAHPDSGHHPHDQHLCNFQSGGVHGKGAARSADDGSACAGGLPDTEVVWARLNELGGLRETGSLPPFSLRRAHLLTTASAQSQRLCGNTFSAVVCLRHRAFSEEGCGCCGSLQTMPQHLWALLSSSACANLPPAALPQRWTGVLPVHFPFYERETE